MKPYPPFFLLLSLIVISCSQNVRITPIDSLDVTQLESQQLKKKRAIILISEIQDAYHTSFGNYGNVRVALRKAFKDRFKKTFSSVDVVYKLPENLEKATVFYPHVNARVVNDFFTKGMLVNMEIEVKDASGTLLSKQNTEYKRTIVLDPKDAFTAALKNAFVQVTDKVIQDLES